MIGSLEPMVDVTVKYYIHSACFESALHWYFLSALLGDCSQSYVTIEFPFTDLCITPDQKRSIMSSVYVFMCVGTLQRERNPDDTA